MQLNGLKGVAAYQTYLRVIFYIRLARETIETAGKDFPALIDEFRELSDEKKKLVLLELMAISPMSDNDIIRLCAVHADENGISYGSSNIGNLSGIEMMELSIKTLIACAQSNDDLFF
jgi:hypothetical protein